MQESDDTTAQTGSEEPTRDPRASSPDPNATQQSPLPPSVPETPEDETPSIDDLLGVFIEESTLWPVLIVAFLSLGAFGAALLVLVFSDRNPFAIAALVLLTGMTTDIVLRARSNPALKNVARGIGLFWLVAGILAVIATQTGIA